MALSALCSSTVASGSGAPGYTVHCLGESWAKDGLLTAPRALHILDKAGRSCHPWDKASGEDCNLGASWSETGMSWDLVKCYDPSLEITCRGMLTPWIVLPVSPYSFSTSHMTLPIDIFNTIFMIVYYTKHSEYSHLRKITCICMQVSTEARSGLEIYGAWCGCWASTKAQAGSALNC